MNEIVGGEIVIVKSGERIAVDGVVLSGQASVNQALITGESMPVANTKGCDVFAGTLNELGALEIQATNVPGDTALDQVKRLIEEADRNQPPIVRTADRYAKYFTPAILILALLDFLFTGRISSALSVLIVACPCALVHNFGSVGVVVNSARLVGARKLA